MVRPNATLSRLEVTALIQIRLRAKLDAQYRAAIHRLIHIGFVNEGAEGYWLTEQGIGRFQDEARKAGLPLTG
jgi:hypothetical protein